MATICAFHRVAKDKTTTPPDRATDREIELAAIIAAAELAFDQVCRTRADLAA